MALPLMWIAIRSMARSILTMAAGAAGTMAGIMATATMTTRSMLAGATVSQGMPASPDTAAEATADDAGSGHGAGRTRHCDRTAAALRWCRRPRASEFLFSLRSRRRRRWHYALQSRR